MKFLRIRKNAVIITVILIIISTLGGSARSLGALRRDTEMVFYNGVSGDGIGIASDLNRRIDLAGNLLTVARKYLADDMAVYNTALATDMLVAALHEHSATSKALGNVYTANRMLTDAAAELISKLSGITLSEKDAGYCRGIETDLKARNNTILHDGYNQMALQYNETLKSFPANLLASLTLTKPLEVFG